MILVLIILVVLALIIYEHRNKTKEDKENSKNPVALNSMLGDPSKIVDPWTDGKSITKQQQFTAPKEAYPPPLNTLEGSLTNPDPCIVYTFQKYENGGWVKQKPSMNLLYAGQGDGCWETQIPSCTWLNWDQGCYDPDQLMADLKVKECQQDKGNKCYSSKGVILKSGDTITQGFSCGSRCSGVLGMIALSFDEGSSTRVLSLAIDGYNSLLKGGESIPVKTDSINSYDPSQRFKAIRYVWNDDKWVENEQGPFAMIYFRKGKDKFVLDKNEGDNYLRVRKMIDGEDPIWILAPPAPLTSQIPGRDNQFCNFSPGGILSFEKPISLLEGMSILTPPTILTSYVEAITKGIIKTVVATDQNKFGDDGDGPQTKNYQSDGDNGKILILEVTTDSDNIAQKIKVKFSSGGYSIGEVVNFGGGNTSVQVTNLQEDTGSGFIGMMDKDGNTYVVEPGSGYKDYVYLEAKFIDGATLPIPSQILYPDDVNIINSKSKNIIVNDTSVVLSDLIKKEEKDIADTILSKIGKSSGDKTRVCRYPQYPTAGSYVVNREDGELGTEEPDFPTKDGESTTSGNVSLEFFDPFANTVVFPKDYFTPLVKSDTTIVFKDSYFLEGNETMDLSDIQVNTTLNAVIVNSSKTSKNNLTYSRCPQQIIYASGDFKEQIKGIKSTSKVASELIKYFKSDEDESLPPRTKKSDLLSVQLEGYNIYTEDDPKNFEIDEDTNPTPYLNTFIPYLNFSIDDKIYHNYTYTQFLPWGYANSFYIQNQEKFVGYTF